MKSLRIAALSFIVVLWAIPAHADSIPPDPHYKTGGAGGGNAAAITTPEFSISSASGASPASSPCVLVQGTVVTSAPLCEFKDEITVNGVEQAITELLFDVGGLAPDTVVSCGFLPGTPFTGCTAGTANPDGFAEVAFFGGSVQYNGVFSLEYGSPSDPFPHNTTTGVTAGVTASVSPEPGTLALFLGGIGSLLMARKIASS